MFFIKKNYVIVNHTCLLRCCCSEIKKITSLFFIQHWVIVMSCHARGPLHRGVHEPGVEDTKKLQTHFHAASTRRDKNTRLAWKCCRTDVLTLLSALSGPQNILLSWGTVNKSEIILLVLRKL